MKRKLWIGLAAGVVVVGGATAWLLKGTKEETRFRTAKVDRGRITQRISATGTINALITVPVGTQVSGVVTALNADFNSVVKKGQVIAQIDPTIWLTQLQDAQASLQRAQATLQNARSDYNRYKELYKHQLVSSSDLEAKQMAFDTANAGVASARSTVAKAKINLGYCTITAPVDGVVVSRLVDVGQTVAASFSTPNLFTIAQDLSKMKVQAAIDEADIGQVQVGQEAYFTVDSYPDRQFKGKVSEVQLNPVITQNVVTYNVVMEVTNEPRSAAPAAGEGRRGGWGRPDGARPEGGRPDGARAQAGRPQGGRPEGTRPEGFPGRHGEGAAAGRAEGGRPRGRRPEGAAPGGKADGSRGPGKGSGMSAPQAATLETATARYIPAGSPVYKGDLALFPGMTANCTIVTNQKQDALRVPSVALRFNPSAFLKGKEAPRTGAAAGAVQGGGQRQQGGGNAARGMVTRREDRVWVLENGKPKALAVTVGISDGQYTEISGPGAGEGLVVLTGVEDLAKKAQSTSPLGGPGGPPPGGGRR